MFSAFDCSNPRGLLDYAQVGTQECTVTPDLADVQNATYVLLQEEKTEAVDGYFCEAYETRDVQHCGMFSHMTSMAEASYTMKPMALSEVDCQIIKHRGYYKDPMGKVHMLQWGQTNIVKYDDVGIRETAKGKVTCHGATMMWQGKEYKDITAVKELRIRMGDEAFETVLDEEGHVDPSAVRARLHRLKLGTSLREGRFRTEEYTFLWAKPKARCALAVARANMTGILATDKKADQVFMSTDGTNIRLLVGKAVSRCDRVMYTTNIRDVYIMDPVEPPLHRRLRPEEASIISYINNRDDYLYHHLKEHIESEFQAVLLHQCREKMRDTRVEFYLSLQQRGVQTYVGLNGTFATSSGEVLYRYQCTPVDVQGLDDEACYTALPVEVVTNPDPASLYPTGTRMFMLPSTRRLVKHASPVSCSTEEFTIKFKNKNGGWVGVYPELRPTSTPKDLPQFEAAQGGVLPNTDFSRGGLYDGPTLRKMETFLQQGDLQQAVAGRIAEQMRLPARAGDPLGPLDFFPAYKGQSFFLDLWTRTLQFTNVFGHLSAIFVGAWTLYQLFFALGRWVYAAIVLRKIPTFSCWWMPCLDCLFARQVARAEEGLMEQAQLVTRVEEQRRLMDDFQRQLDEAVLRSLQQSHIYSPNVTGAASLAPGTASLGPGPTSTYSPSLARAHTRKMSLGTFQPIKEAPEEDPLLPMYPVV